MGKLGIVKPTATGKIDDVHPGTTIEPTSICSIWVPVGLYIVIGTAKFTLPKQSQIEIHIGSTDNKHSIGSTILTLPAGIQWAKNVGVIKIEETSKQVVLRVRQDSGSIISCTANLEAIQIK